MGLAGVNVYGVRQEGEFVDPNGGNFARMAVEVSSGLGGHPSG